MCWFCLCSNKVIVIVIFHQQCEHVFMHSRLEPYAETSWKQPTVDELILAGLLIYIHLYISDVLCVSEEVRSALDIKKPVVALESTIITHGMPYPQNYQYVPLITTIYFTDVVSL